MALTPKLDGTIPAAHLNIRGAAILVVFLDSAFELRTPEERAAAYAAIQAAAAKQGFDGDVAVLWEDSAGRTRFIAPPQQHPFFQIVKYGQLRAQANEALDVAPAIAAPPG